MTAWFTPIQDFYHYFDENDIYIMPIGEDGKINLT